jgi:hypothetical protein
VTRFAGWYVRAAITRWVDDHQPGFVEYRFTDRFGHEWTIVEKLPVVTANESVWSNRRFPQPAFIAREIVSRGRDETGNEIAEISIEKPCAIEALDGTTRFEVLASQLTQCAD